MSSVLALVALTPTVSAAQSNRLFENAWFWGAKAGLMNFSTGIENKTAPLIGAEWLITRSKAGLYLSAEQAFFTATGYVFDGNGNQVNVKDGNAYITMAGGQQFSRSFIGVPLMPSQGRWIVLPCCNCGSICLARSIGPAINCGKKQTNVAKRRRLRSRGTLPR